MTSSSTIVNEKCEAGKNNVRNDEPESIDTSVGQDTHILYNAAVNKNGIKLHPQPTADSLDPLNWSSLQKHVILSIVMFKYV